VSIDAVSLIKAFSAYVCSFKLYCLFNTMKDAKIANNIVERLTKRIMKKLLQVVPLSEQKEPHSRD
jgi:hypothetical protein